MNSGGDRPSGKAADFSNRGGVLTFEVEQDHLSIERLHTQEQVMDLSQGQPIQHLLLM